MKGKFTQEVGYNTNVHTILHTQGKINFIRSVNMLL